MRQWLTACRAGHSCGSCGQAIPVGQPFLTVVIPGARWPRERCANCAGESVPQAVEDEPRPPVVPVPLSLKRSRDMVSTKALAADVKLARIPEGDQ